MKVIVPESLEQALACLDQKAIPIAGGTDLLVHWPNRLDAHEKTYLDLSALEGLRAVQWTDEALILGALTTYWDIICDQTARREMKILVDAARTVGAVQIQSRGTWAGNIANGSPAADGVAALMALDAVVEVAGTRGKQRFPLDSFYTGYKKSRKSPDQLITKVHIPRRTRTFESFVKVGTRAAQAISKVALALTCGDDGWRVVVNSMAPVVTRCPAIEKLLNTRSPISSPSGFTQAINADLSPIDDIRSTATYRTRTLARLLYHELAPVCPWIGDETA